MATRRAWSGAMLLVGLLALPAWAQQGPTQADLNAASTNAADWLHTNHDYDPVRGLVYVPLGNPAPDYCGDVRRGGNLYTNSLVVLEARTGTSCGTIRRCRTIPTIGT